MTEPLDYQPPQPHSRRRASVFTAAVIATGAHTIASIAFVLLGWYLTSNTSGFTEQIGDALRRVGGALIFPVLPLLSGHLSWLIVIAALILNSMLWGAVIAAIYRSAVRLRRRST